MSSKRNDHIVAVICVIVFLALTLVIPFLGIVGGLYSQTVTLDYLGSTITQQNEYMWDGIEESVDFIISITVTVSYDDMATGSQAGSLWNISGLWGPIYIILTLLGGGAVLIYAFLKMNGDNPNQLLNIGGLLLGLIGTVGEWVILTITIMSEDWELLADAMGAIGGTVTTPKINILLLGIFIIGWISLIYGSIRATEPPVTTYDTAIKIKSTALEKDPRNLFSDAMPQRDMKTSIEFQRRLDSSSNMVLAEENEEIASLQKKLENRTRKPGFLENTENKKWAMWFFEQTEKRALGKISDNNYLTVLKNYEKYLDSKSD